MPQGRMLSKKISNDENVAQLSLPATLLYTWMIPHLDQKGRIYGDIWTLKSIVPYISELTPRRIRSCIDEFIDKDLVWYYGNDHKYLEFKGFDKNQTIHPEREAKSTIPGHDENMTKTPSDHQESKVNKSKVNKKLFSFESIYERYPKKVGKKQAERHFYSSIKTEEDFVNMNLALDNYLKSERVFKNYIQNASTWFNNWADWINYKEDICSKCKGNGKFSHPVTGYEVMCDCPKGKSL